MPSANSSQNGFSLIETMIALSIMTVGVLGAAGILATGMQNLSSSPGDVVVTQKAAQAIEAVFSARDSHKLVWSQIQNVTGACTTGGPIFVSGPTPLRMPGVDGLVNTCDDDTAIETVVLPGKDGVLGTVAVPSLDDQTMTLSQYTREITIRDVTGENGSLRKITVTVTYQNGPTRRVYTLISYISSYS